VKGETKVEKQTNRQTDRAGIVQWT
jgi:hypothetical protein